MYSSLIYCSVNSSALTTNVHYGRFGDQLLLYYVTKKLAWLLDLPFLYKSFEYSDQLYLHEIESRYESRNINQFHAMKSVSYALAGIEPNTLYTYSFGENINFPGNNTKNYSEFLAHMRKMISPRVKVNEINLPKNIITVAVHVRKGGGFDAPLFSQQEYTSIQLEQAQGKSNPKGNYSDVTHPYKFPPDQFYIDQINRLSELLGNVPIYLYIFTDDKNPDSIKQRYEKAVNKPNITFDSKSDQNVYNNNVLDEFFSMMKFDCLIRAGSAFSLMVEIIGSNTISIYPKKITWCGDILVVQEVETVIKDSSLIYQN